MTSFLNMISPGIGSKRDKKRKGRGIGSTLGKTGGRGHKGQHSRAGGTHRVGFEGGQMPLHRRLPKVGFKSRRAPVANVSLASILKKGVTEVNIETLVGAGLIDRGVAAAKIIGGGLCTQPLSIVGVAVSKSVRLAVEQANGTVSAESQV